MPRWYRMLLMPKAVAEGQRVKVEKQSVKSSQVHVKPVVLDLPRYQNQLSQSCTPPHHPRDLTPSIEGAEGPGAQRLHLLFGDT